MKLVTVTVGPLTAADNDGIIASQRCGGAHALTLNGALATGFSAANICASQTPGGAGNLTLNGTLVVSGVAYMPSGASVSITCAGNNSGVTFTVTGRVFQANGAEVYRSETITGVNTSVTSTRTIFSTVTQISISGASTGAVTVGTNGTSASLDMGRRVLITSAGNDSAITYTIYGTDWSDNPVSEVVTGPNATTAQSTRDFKTVTAIWPSAAVASTVIIGTSSVASSRPIFMDRFGFSASALQVDVSGTVNYTIQQTLDDPFEVSYSALNWVSHPDSAVVGATATAQANYAYLPNMTRILLNSGTGTVSYTVLQEASPT